MADLENYKVRIRRQENDDNIGLYDISVFPAELELTGAETPHGMMTICDSRSVKAGDEITEEVHLSNAVTYVGFGIKEAKEGEEPLTKEELFDIAFAALKTMGVEEVNFCTNNKEEGDFVEALGFNLDRTVTSGYFPIYYYSKEI